MCGSVNLPHSWHLRYGHFINEGPTMTRSGGALLCPSDPGRTECRVPPSSGFRGQANGGRAAYERTTGEHSP